MKRWNDAALALLKGKPAFFELNPRAARVTIRIECGAEGVAATLAAHLRAALEETKQTEGET
ncbi:MAG: hypothetical protein KGJ23_07925 [Euryarchaeota archaeon]|nr:hypothetical protein [Euryarchaeota archaeon]MDE1836528.1 hypothetical protein [Euryarchaeota archaeon]MDE1879277.1 hypothetical protein [Euryarchaeota archaeon]MDE2044498.1 hypothetical protein [Thermoplasmata archaeon]